MSHTPLVHCWVAIFSIWRPVQSLWRTYLSELVFRFEKNNGDRIHGHQTRYRGGVPLGNRRNCTAWRDTGDRMYKWCMRDSLHTTFVIILHVLAILKLKSAAFFLSVKFHLWDFRNMKLWKITSFEQHESGELSHKWKCNELCKSFFFLLFPSYHLCGFARKKKKERLPGTSYITAYSLGALVHWYCLVAICAILCFDMDCDEWEPSVTG